MASSQLMNSTGGDGASSSLIIPKIPSESKRRELTDAIHHCFKLMLENNLAVSTISRETSMLAKLIGQEIFFRIVKMIYEIQFNVGKEDPPKADKEKVLSASARKVKDGIRVKREPPSPPPFMVDELIIKSEDGTNSPSETEEQSTMALFSVQKNVGRAAELESDESIRAQGENRVEASSALGPSEEVLEESRIKNEPPSPPPPMVYISFEDRDSSHSLSDDEIQRRTVPFSVKEKVRAAELKPNLSIISEGENMVEASSAQGPTEEVLEETRIESEPPSPMVEESDMSSDDGDSTYSPSEDESPRPPVPFSIKEKVVRAAELNPSWTCKSLSTISSKLKNSKQLSRWKKQVKAGRGKMEKYNLMTTWVLERAKKATQDSLPVTTKLLRQWGVEASALYAVDGFKSSEGWVKAIRKKLREIP